MYNNDINHDGNIQLTIVLTLILVLFLGVFSSTAQLETDTEVNCWLGGHTV